MIGQSVVPSWIDVIDLWYMVYSKSVNIRRIIQKLWDILDYIQIHNITGFKINLRVRLNSILCDYFSLFICTSISPLTVEGWTMLCLFSIGHRTSINIQLKHAAYIHREGAYSLSSSETNVCITYL